MSGKKIKQVLVRVHTSGDEKKDKMQKNLIVTKPHGVDLDLTYVKTEVIAVLQPRWNSKGVTLVPDNIKVFLICGTEAKEVGGDLKPLHPGTAQSEEGHKFVALEYFTTVPEDLFRTVKPSALEPAVFAHPTHASTAWTSVSPLYCAGFNMRRAEDVLRIDIKKDGDYKVHGVSLRCEDENETAWPATEQDPFRAIGQDETKGRVSMTLQQCTAAAGYAAHDVNFGFLKSTVTMADPEPGRLSSGSRFKASKVECAKNQAGVTKREAFVRFKLGKGLDLSGYGVAVVYDRSSATHFSLVPVNTGTTNAHLWTPYVSLRPHTPVHLRDDLHEAVAAADMNPTSLLQSTDIFNPDHGEDAESCTADDYVYLPKVASLFELHDMSMTASGEPSPPELGPGDDVECLSLMYEGALVLHHLDLGWEVELAIEALQEKNYAVDTIGKQFRDTLIDQFSEGTPDAEVAVSILGWDDDRAARALDAMRCMML